MTRISELLLLKLLPLNKCLWKLMAKMSIKTYKKLLHFKSGDFDVNEKEHDKPPKKFKNKKLQVLVDEDATRTQEQLASSLIVTQKNPFCSYERYGEDSKGMKIGTICVDRKNKEQRKMTCEILFKLFQRKFFLHCIVTGNEN